MSDRIKKIKVKKADGSMTDYIPIGVDAENVDFDNGYKLDNIVGSINPDESGSIAAQLSKSIKYYDCVADMKADTTLNGGGAARTLGYYEPGDGGGALYQIIDDSDARYSTSTDDGGSVHDLTNGNKALLNIDNNTIWVKQFGAYGDNTHDDTNELTRLFTFVRNSSTIRKIMFNIGRYYITDSLSVPSNVIIEGINQSCLPENVNRNKFSSIVRKTNITIFELIGEPYSVSGGGISNVQINNLTIRTITNDYFDAPAIIFCRSLYNKFNNLNFYGDGKALYFMEGCFDSRFSNCEFAGNALLETKSTVADEYHGGEWYGINQIFFYGCRWESYTLDKVCYFGNNTHDMNFINCKWEGKTQNNGAVIEGGINSNIIFDDCHMTCNETSLCSLFKFEKIHGGKFNFYFVDNTAAERTLPYFIFNEGSRLDINFNGIANIDKYLCEYYIENTTRLSINSITGNFFSSTYFNPSRIRHFKNPQLQNKSVMLYNNNYSDRVGDDRIYIQMNKTLNKDDAKVWTFYPNYDSYANDVTKIDIISPTNKSLMTLYEGSCKFHSKVEVPTLTTAPSYTANGEIYVNNYSDSSNPLWTFGVNSSGKGIGWSDAAPTTGTHTKGTIIFNTNPSAGGTIGWICVTAGSPGIWKTFGAIES